MEQSTGEKVFRRYIYIKRDGKYYYYLQLEKDCINDGRRAEGNMQSFSKKFGIGGAGSIFELETIEKGTSTSVSLKSKNYSIGYWKNREQIIEWQAEERVVEDAKALDKAAKEDKLLTILFPIRRAYKNCRNKNERTVLLARIIDYIQTY